MVNERILERLREKGAALARLPEGWRLADTTSYEEGFDIRLEREDGTDALVVSFGPADGRPLAYTLSYAAPGAAVAQEVYGPCPLHPGAPDVADALVGCCVSFDNARAQMAAEDVPVDEEAPEQDEAEEDEEQPLWVLSVVCKCRYLEHDGTMVGWDVDRREEEFEDDEAAREAYLDACDAADRHMKWDDWGDALERAVVTLTLGDFPVGAYDPGIDLERKLEARGEDPWYQEAVEATDPWANGLCDPDEPFEAPKPEEDATAQTSRMRQVLQYFKEQQEERERARELGLA